MDEEKFGCCSTCVYYDSGICDECEEADQYEFDEELIEDSMKEKVAA